MCWGNRMEAAFEDFVVTEGGVGFHGTSWAGLRALNPLVQRVLRIPHRPVTRHINSGHLPHMVEKYQEMLLSFGMEMERLPHTTQPRGRKAPKQSYNDTKSRFDDKYSDECTFLSLVPHKYL